MKSALVKAIEKQNKVTGKAERKARIRQIATSIIDGQPVLFDVRIMDSDSEEILNAIISQYDGNDDNHVNFCVDDLPRSLQDSIAVQYEKLMMYGMISSCIPYGGGAVITLSNSAKTYQERKQKAISQDLEEKKRRERLETDYLKIQSMTADQLRKIYLQAIEANRTLQQSLEVQNKQLNVIKDLFASGEDGVAVQKEIMRVLFEQEEDKHLVREYLSDKGGDLGVAAIAAATPMIWSGIKAWLATKGVILP